jgi:enamine deaminase RidA (YjgF/YER057c/UK114 family)
MDSRSLPEYFMLRPEVEKAYGYTHAIRIGHDIKISGAVSMDDQGNPTAVGDFEQQMKNVYADLEKVLQHYGCTFDDVIVENVYTTNMAKFLEVAAYRASIYTKQFPTGTWLEVKGLALPEFLIEIELEAYAPGVGGEPALIGEPLAIRLRTSAVSRLTTSRRPRSEETPFKGRSGCRAPRPCAPLYRMLREPPLAPGAVSRPRAHGYRYGASRPIGIPSSQNTASWSPNVTMAAAAIGRHSEMSVPIPMPRTYRAQKAITSGNW